MKKTTKIILKNTGFMLLAIIFATMDNYLAIVGGFILGCLLYNLCKYECTVKEAIDKRDTKTGGKEKW